MTQKRKPVVQLITALVMSLVGLTAMLSGFSESPTAQAQGGDTTRFATFNASLNRNTAGQLVTDLSVMTNTQAQSVAEIIQRVNPDVLLINEFDYDAAGQAAQLFQDNYLSISQNGATPISYPYRFVAPSNTGIASGFDLNNNGTVVTQTGEAGYGDDAFGFGNFPGQYGMVLYSKYPISGTVRTFQNFLWKDMPNALLPDDPNTPAANDWYATEELNIFRLSSKSHWDVPLDINGQIVHVLVSHPTPPTFDGAEDRNGRRNHDEIRFWADYITPGQGSYITDDAGVTGGLPAGSRFVIMGDQNADPADGDSTNNAILQLLNNANINTSVIPSSQGAVEQATLQAQANISHTGNPAYDTADFSDSAPGNLRVDYVLPSINMTILNSGVFWPLTTDPLFPLVGTFPFPTSDHRLVWSDVQVNNSRFTIQAIQGMNSDSPVAGKVVSTEGIVTANFDNDEIFVQNGTGPRSGIMAFRPTGPVTVGDYIVITGTVEERFGLTQFASGGQTAVISSGNALPATQVLTTGAVANENWESVLVRVENVTVSNGDLGFGEWELNDGSGPTRVDDLGRFSYAPTTGDLLDYVQGPLFYSFSNFKIVPRGDTDIGRTTLSKQSPGSVTPGSLYTYTLTIDNQSGLTLTNISLTDTVPASSTLAYVLNGGTANGNIVSWTGLSVTNRTTMTVQFAVTATTVTGTIISNRDYGFTATNYARTIRGQTANTVVGGVTIPIIQGSAAASPLQGQNVTVSGVVVADFQAAGQMNGFFMQDATGDGNPATSDGIFVAALTNTADVNLGQLVEVTGQVQELNEQTIIAQVTAISVTGTGPTISPTLVSLPETTNGDLEKYEGMLVTVPQTLTLSQNYNQGQYGQLTLASGGRLFKSTNVFTPSTPEATALAAENSRRLLVLDDASLTQYPNPIPYLGVNNTSRAGDVVVSGLTGALDSGPIYFGPGNDYRLQPTAAISLSRVNTRSEMPMAVSGTLKVASFNVLNYFTTFGSRGAENQAEFDRQRAKIITALLKIDADVVGLMEIENNGYGANSAIQDLVNGLNANAPAGTTYGFINPGTPQLGNDEITVGFIYKMNTVTPVGSAATINTGAFADFNRQPLAQTFRETATNGQVTVVVNHFKSKGSGTGLPADEDQGDGQGFSNAIRTQAANELAAWLATDPTSSNDPDFLIIGDLNAYALEDPIRALTGQGYANLVWQYGGQFAYSYVFDGEAGYLDHALSNTDLTAQVTGATVWHINADEPVVLDYNQNNKTQDLYQTTAYRSSDHDPVIVGLNLTPLQLVATIRLTKTVGLNSDLCAPSNRLTVTVGTAVTYCYTVMNTGQITLTTHSLWDDHLGIILNSTPYTLTPGSSLPVTTTVTLTTPGMLTNTATFTASDGVNTAVASATATVMVEPSPVVTPTTTTLTLLHNNDGESALLSLNASVPPGDFGNSTTETIKVGNVAAFKTVFEQQISQARSNNHSVLGVYAGDSFLASVNLSCTLDDPTAPIYDAVAQRQIPYNAHILGNHEFDFGPDFLARFIRAFELNGQLRQPFLSANIDFRKVAAFNDLIDADGLIEGMTTDGRVVAHSAIITDAVTGQGFGLVSANTWDLNNISSPAPAFVTTSDLTSTATVAQQEIDRLVSRGINKIIFISHLQSLDNDKELLPLLRHVDLAVGGGGDELLINPTLPVTTQVLPGEVEPVKGDYPTQLTDADGQPVYLVTGVGQYKYVGRLDVEFDDQGNVTRVITEASYPRRVIPDVAENSNINSQLPAISPVQLAALDQPIVNEVINPVQSCVAALDEPLIGLEVVLDMRRSAVRTQETNGGNSIADAYLWIYEQYKAANGLPTVRQGEKPLIALQNGGGIRIDNYLPQDQTVPGTMSRADTRNNLPFGNRMTVVEDVTPTDLKHIFERAVASLPNQGGQFLQIAGLTVTIDTTGTAQEITTEGVVTTAGSRVVSIVLADGTVLVENGAVITGATNVTVITNKFTADGGDTYPWLGDNPHKTDLVDNNGVVFDYEQAWIRYLLNSPAEFPDRTIGTFTGPTILASDARYQVGGEGRILIDQQQPTMVMVYLPLLLKQEVATPTPTTTGVPTDTPTPTPTATSPGTSNPQSRIDVSEFTDTNGNGQLDAGEPVVIKVIITNMGNGPITQGFWVDFYINPLQVPVNGGRWDSPELLNRQLDPNGVQGLAWRVTPEMFGGSLDPGETITLVSLPGDPFGYHGPQTIWRGSFAAGTTHLYVYMDSYPANGGNIEEGDETNNLHHLGPADGFGPLGEAGNLINALPRPQLPPREPF